MAIAAFRRLIIASMLVGFNASGWAQEKDTGKAEYLSSCAACHGADGKGNGPMSAELKRVPPNLTVLAKNNNGVFPFETVHEIIDGRRLVSAHGTRDMPIFGFRDFNFFNFDLRPSIADLAVRARIMALVDYLNRIQRK